MLAVQKLSVAIALGVAVLSAEPNRVDFSSVMADSATPISKPTPNPIDPTWASTRPTIAVFDLQGDLYSAKEASRLTDLLRSKLAASGNFVLIGAERTAALHDPHFGAMSHCSELNCAWRATKLLQADFVVVGTVDRALGALVLKLLVVDEESGEVVQKLDYRSDRDAHSETWIPNAVARMAMFSPVAMGSISGAPSEGQPMTPARQLLEKSDDYRFTKRSAFLLDIAGTVIGSMGISKVSEENQICRDRYRYTYPYKVPSSCEDVRMTRGTVVFAVGAVIQAIGLVQTFETFVVGRELKRLENAAGHPAISVSPIYEPIRGTTGVLASLEF